MPGGQIRNTASLALCDVELCWLRRRLVQAEAKFVASLLKKPCLQCSIFNIPEQSMPPDILACIFVPLHCETLDDGTAEGERERGVATAHPPSPRAKQRGVSVSGGSHRHIQGHRHTPTPERGQSD